MKKKLYTFVLMSLLLAIVAACTPGPVVAVNTPAPTAKAGTGTPVPGNQIDIPGVSIQINAPGPNPLVNKPDAHGQVAGVLTGIWHGIISPVTIVLSFVNEDVQMYEIHNDGSQYNLGFFLGIVILFVILSIAMGSRNRTK